MDPVSVNVLHNRSLMVPDDDLCSYHYTNLESSALFRETL